MSGWQQQFWESEEIDLSADKINPATETSA
jgi:hypothetical protein